MLWYLKNKESKTFHSIDFFIHPPDVLHLHDHSNSTSRTFSIKRTNHHDFPLSNHWRFETSLRTIVRCLTYFQGASRHPNVKGETPFNGGRKIREDFYILSFLSFFIAHLHPYRFTMIPRRAKISTVCRFRFPRRALSPSKRTLQMRIVYWIVYTVRLSKRPWI